MKKAQFILSGLAAMAFYIGAACFFADGNETAGIVGTIAATLWLVSFIMNARSAKNGR